GRPTRLLAMQGIFYVPGHQVMYDAETLELVFRAAGFHSPVERAFGDSAIQPCPDSPHRRLSSLYVEAVR
ncbi:MAG: hypothetical protein M3295_10045, partial [Chloroflexota bacterium]|nr:hypothetical protein [Chloroflexota bacterium]